MRSGFFNSEITGYTEKGIPIFDRAEDAEFFALFYKTLFTNGVFPNPSTNLQVIATDGMNVKVSPGICFIEGYFGFEDTDRVMAVQASEALDRIDRVVLRLNLANRLIDIYVVKGIAATNPVAPALTRPQPNQGGDIYELGIADLFIAKNTTSITQQRITDTRMNNNLCGIVTQTVDGIDTTTLFIQLQDQIDKNIEIIQSAIDETMYGEIIAKIDQSNLRISILETNKQSKNIYYGWLSIPAGSWKNGTADIGAGYTWYYDIPWNGITPSMRCEVVFDQWAVEKAIFASVCNPLTNAIRIYANKQPTENTGIYSMKAEVV